MPTGGRKQGAESERNPLGRALRLVSHIVDRDPTRAWGVRELAMALDLPISGVHRTLAALKDEGWLVRSEQEGTYYLSLEVFRLAMSLSSQLPLARIAMPVMFDLVKECGENALLGLFDHARLQMSFIAQVESPHPLRYVIDLHHWGPIHAGATGLAILAFLPAEVQDEVISRCGLPRLTERTVTDPMKLRKELALVRRRGYAITKGQRIAGSVGIAAPVFASDGSVIGDLAVTLPEQRFLGLEDSKELALRVVHYANIVTEKLRSR